MRAIGCPAVLMGLLVRPTHVLQDNAWGRAAGEMTPHDLPVAAPQTLNDLGTGYRRCAGRSEHHRSKTSVELIRLGQVFRSLVSSILKLRKQRSLTMLSIAFECMNAGQIREALAAQPPSQAGHKIAGEHFPELGSLTQ